MRLTAIPLMVVPSHHCQDFYNITPFHGGSGTLQECEMRERYDSCGCGEREMETGWEHLK